MVSTLKRAMDVNSLSQLETELNQFIYTYNYTPCEAAPDHKSPAEIFFGRKLRTPLEMFSPDPKPNKSLTDRQKKMKQQFDSYHGTKPRQFVPGQTVVVQLADGRRVSRTFIRKVGKTIAHIRVANKLITQHFNQIWNRTAGPSNRQQAVNADLLPSCQTPEADATHRQITPDISPRRSGADHSNDTQTEAADETIRRSKRLVNQRRPDYKAVAGVRCYRQHHL
ncbi:hypothetical protein RF55_14746 [Lasius niger]|uniref:Uncharacterized protein n=1 Tax=Lasius niger TaxID=67767 RepID=A0A0J7K7W9_LASNI|nr:hypothetical protein RF55_14746 [Lasius niger]